MEQGKNMRFSNTELEVLRTHFKGNEPLLKLLRKVFLPELDPDVPLGQQIDLWMTINLESLKPDQALIQLHARNSLIVHLETQLMQLRNLSEMTIESPEESTERQKKDSSK